MAWEIELTEQVETWLLEELDDEGRRQIVPAIDELEATGPTLGRPFVDTTKASRHSNMKELRSIGGNLRILFAFDQDRRAILLIAGDKTGNWKPWYATNIPKGTPSLILYERNDPMPDTKTSKWRDVRKRAVKAADEPYIKQGREAIRAELRLSSVRKQRKASQAAVAERLAVSQSNVSQLERVGDPRLSTVADYIGALGGRLEIAAVFDDERVTIAGPPTGGAAHRTRGARARKGTARAKSTDRVKSTKAKAATKAASRTKRAPAKASRP